jgi:hypothetical protein
VEVVNDAMLDAVKEYRRVIERRITGKLTKNRVRKQRCRPRIVESLSMTISRKCAVKPGDASHALRFGKMRAIRHHRTKLGTDQFLLTYALGVAQLGYEHCPLEAIAFDLQTRFEQNADLHGIVAHVEQHAINRRDAAATVFRRQGIEVGE